tara:strand:- start:67 stop:381 length:315 start_codon:yes stop_codon:yes gene_type:complete
MSNVFSNASFAVLSVMEYHSTNSWVGATAFVQKKPETDYSDITTVSFASADWDNKDFQVQARFDANIAPNIMMQLNDMASANTGFLAIKSNLSTASYKMTAVEI